MVPPQGGVVVSRLVRCIFSQDDWVAIAGVQAGEAAKVPINEISIIKYLRAAELSFRNHVAVLDQEEEMRIN